MVLSQVIHTAAMGYPELTISFRGEGKKTPPSLGAVAHICNPSYLGEFISKFSLGKKLERP
jgi:hypothetical protein